MKDILDSQFQWVPRQNDALIKVESPEHGEFLILTELQLKYIEQMPRRIRTYAALPGEKYQLPTYPVLVNILQPGPKTKIAKRFDETFMGLQARQDYRIINLWDIDATLVFERNLSTLLPFVQTLKGGGQQAL